VSLEQHSHDGGSQVCYEVSVQPGMNLVLVVVPWGICSAG